MEKILITGTGRCGTTFLIKIFSFLEFDTGYTKNNYKNFIYSNCNSGMEREYNENYYILKNPKFISQIKNIVEDSTIKIKTIIIPIRDFKLSAISRKNNGSRVPGGLWNANTVENQIDYYKNIMTDYVHIMTKYDINTIFLDFDKMISDKIYLFNKIKNILDEKNIDFYLFSSVYDEVTLTSKP
jgi:hypothetical protein